METVHSDHESPCHDLGSEYLPSLKYVLANNQTVFIATASLLFLSDKFQFNPEAVS